MRLAPTPARHDQSERSQDAAERDREKAGPHVLRLTDAVVRPRVGRDKGVECDQQRTADKVTQVKVLHGVIDGEAVGGKEEGKRGGASNNLLGAKRAREPVRNFVCEA